MQRIVAFAALALTLAASGARAEILAMANYESRPPRR